MTKQTTVDDLWPGDLMFFGQSMRRVVSVEAVPQRDDMACVRFVDIVGMFYWDSEIHVQSFE